MGALPYLRHSGFETIPHYKDGGCSINPILIAVFHQRILHRGGPYLTPKPKVMRTPNLAGELVFTKFF